MLTSELPVYKDTYSLVNLLLDYTVKFPKMYKYTMGEKIQNVSLGLFECLQLANRAVKDKPARARHLDSFLVRFELLKILLRLCQDKHIISLKQTARVAELTSKIGKQITGWKNKA